MAAGTWTPGSVRVGTDFYSQLITISGSPSGGYWFASYLESRTQPIAYNASATTVRDALRRLPYLVDVNVTGSAGGPWAVSHGAFNSLVEPLRVNGFALTGGAAPEIVCTVVAREPLRYWIAEPGLLSEGTVAQRVAKVVEASTPNADRADQPILSEYIVVDGSGGFGRYKSKESQSVTRIWDSSLRVDVPYQLTLSALEETDPVDIAIATALGAAALTCWADGIGLTANGVRHIKLVDPDGTGTTSAPVYWDETTVQWKLIPKAAGTWAGITGPGSIHFYRGSAFITFQQSGPTKGYIQWTGSGNATFTDTTATGAVLDWSEYDQKLVRLMSTGQLQWVASLPTPASDADWSALGPIYEGVGYAYAIQPFQKLDGTAVTFVIATDGMWEYILESAVLVNRIHFQGLPVWSTGTYPQANSVVIFDGQIAWIDDVTVRLWDGKSPVRSIGPAVDDGLPTGSVVHTQELKPRALYALNNMLLCALSNPVENLAATTISAPTTDSIDTTYYGILTISDTLTVSAMVTVTSGADTIGEILGWNREGWVPVVPLQTTVGIRSIAFSSLLLPTRISYGPNRLIRWRDQPSNPIFWTSIKYRASGYHITPWYDKDQTEVDKLGAFIDASFRQVGGPANGQRITPYFQIDYAPESTTFDIGSDPTRHWVQLVDIYGNVISCGDGDGDNDDGPNGKVRGYMGVESDPFRYSRGRQFRQWRLGLYVQTDDPLITPIWEFGDLGHMARFDTIFSFPLELDLGRDAPDSRSPLRCLLDLEATHRSKDVHVYSERPDSFHPVLLDYLTVQGFASGNDPTYGSAMPVAKVNLSEPSRVDI